MKNSIKIIWGWSIELILLFAATIGVYTYNFHGEHFSKAAADWGTFGDFIGGFLGPILAIINISVLLYLTFKIAEAEHDRTMNMSAIEEMRNEKSLQLERDIAINSIKLDGYKEINELYLKISVAAIEKNNFGDKDFMKYKIEFHTIVSPYINLFNTFNDLNRINKVGNTIFELGKWLELEENRFGQAKDLQLNMNNEFIKTYTGLLNDLIEELFIIS